MKLGFKQIDSDKTLESLTTLLDTLVMVKAIQYQFESDLLLNHEFFRNEEKYKIFFEQFAQYANPLWQDDWDFRNVPFKSLSEEISGLFSVIRSGGAYSKEKTFSEASQIEKEFRHRFRGPSSELVVLSMVDYVYMNQETKSYGVNMADLTSLGKISPWFFQIGWDNLIFIINPEMRMMYVIAITDED